MSFLEGTLQAFLLLVLAETGDKTFLMIVLLSSKINKWVLWTIAVVAETTMSAVSVTIGSIIPWFIPMNIVEWLVSALMFGYGFYMLYSGCKEDNDDDDSTVFSEMSEAEEAIEKFEAIQSK